MEDENAQKYYESAINDFEHHKRSINRRVNSVERLDLVLNVLTYKIFSTQHEYRINMLELERCKEDILGKNIDDDDVIGAVQEIERKMTELTVEHESIMSHLNEEREKLNQESKFQIRHMDDKIIDIQKLHTSVQMVLDEQKLACSSSTQLKEIEHKVDDMNKVFEQYIAELLKLQETGWRQEAAEEKLAALVEQRGLRVTKSGRFLTGSGRLLNREEVECLGMLEGIDLSIDHIAANATPVETVEKESSASSIASLSPSELGVDDTTYLKEALGRALTLGIAELTCKKPKNPIHYLSHWLFKYRYNQEVNVTRKIEIEELIDERERLAKILQQQQLEEEARAVVLDIVIRAEEEGMRRELEAELRRIAEEEPRLQMETEK